MGSDGTDNSHEATDLIATRTPVANRRHPQQPEPGTQNHLARPDHNAPPSPENEAPGSQNRRALDLVCRLADSLEASGIEYCHWKSNTHLAGAIQGNGDLDLLISQSHGAEFSQILAQLGFSRANNINGHIPGIESFYGLDAKTLSLVHVHAHYQLILGHDRTKNYRLPIELEYIRSASRTGVLSTPAPEFEYIILVIRLALKYFTWDELAWNALRLRGTSPKVSEKEELADLTARVDHRKVTNTLMTHLPFISTGLFAKCVNAITTDSSPKQRIAAVRELESRLQPLACHSRGTDRALRISRRATHTIRQRRDRNHRNRLVTGGAMIALIGGDGAGKSTAIEELSSWLGNEFDLRSIHLGKPPWSPATYATRSILKIARIVVQGAMGNRNAAKTKRLGKLSNRLCYYTPLIWHLCAARDRSRLYFSARRFATGGGLVLSDRYPHPALRLMDVPQIKRLTREHASKRSIKAMISLEERYYEPISAPELIIVLKLDPEIAVDRKRSESAESVRTRGTEIWDGNWSGPNTYTIDASQPKETVLSELKELVWSKIT